MSLISNHNDIPSNNVETPSCFLSSSRHPAPSHGKGNVDPVRSRLPLLKNPPKFNKQPSPSAQSSVSHVSANKAQNSDKPKNITIVELGKCVAKSKVPISSKFVGSKIFERDNHSKSLRNESYAPTLPPKSNSRNPKVEEEVLFVMKQPENLVESAYDVSRSVAIGT